MKLSHLDSEGNIRMVDVGDKNPSRRVAVASGRISMSAEAFQAIINGEIKKGNVLATAKVAAIMAAKRTADTIPLCHPLPISQIEVEFEPDAQSSSIRAEITVRVDGKTGVEMEAMHATTVALLTIYDMAKAVDKGMVMSEICLLSKSGGKSGEYLRQED